MKRLNPFMVIAFSLALTTSGFGLDVVQHTGTIGLGSDRIPGYPSGTLLNYSARAVKTGGDKNAHFWMDLENPNSFPINVVLCAMLSLRQSGDDVPRFNVDTDTPPTEWRCLTAPLQSGIPPNFHFSCSQVTVPAALGSTPGKLNAIDKAVTFSQPFTQGELGAIYFDLLRDLPVRDCGPVVGTDKWVVPLNPIAHTEQENPDWNNWWAGHKRFQDLTAIGGFQSAAVESIGSQGTSRCGWPSGNWVTMGFPDLYPARLRGTLIGAPDGTVVQFEFDGKPGGQYVVKAPKEDPNVPPGQSRLSFDEPFTISKSVGAEDGVSLTVPNDNRGIVEEGRVVRFSAEVIAEPGTLFYAPGQFMYGIHAVFVKDTQPPVVESLKVRPKGDSLSINVSASDATTMAIGATFVYSVGGGPEVELPIDYDNPPVVGETSFFAGHFEGLPLDVPITYRVDVYDDIGNRGSSKAQCVRLHRGQAGVPCRGEHADAGD
jgi:hypothetical protein